MARLMYTAITSLDGYIEDEDGRFDGAAPDTEASIRVGARRGERPRRLNTSR